VEDAAVGFCALFRVLPHTGNAYVKYAARFTPQYLHLNFYLACWNALFHHPRPNNRRVQYYQLSEKQKMTLLV
jgi:hypothetical protein